MTLKLVHSQDANAKALGKQLAETTVPISGNRLTAMNLGSTQVRCHGSQYGDFTFLLEGLSATDPERPLIESLIRILKVTRGQYRATPETDMAAHQAIGDAWASCVKALQRYEMLKARVK